MVGNSTGVQLTLGLVIMGAASRAISPIIMLILMDAPQVGPQRMGAAGGLYFMVGEVGGVLGPVFLGVIADLSGGFLASLIMLAAMSVVLAAFSLRLGFLLRKMD
jgi:cyanate permease